jgi:AraC-like DNA-binding protein
MISLERLLNGLCVSVDGVVVGDLRREHPPDRAVNHVTVRFGAKGVVMLELVGGALIRFESDTVTVLPARTRPRAEGTLAARPGAGRNDLPEVPREAGEKELMVATGRWRASYLGSIGLFDQLREPLVESLRKGDPISSSFRELFDEIASQRPGRRAMLELLFWRSLILFLRRCCGHEGGAAWMAAMEDVGLSRALATMRDYPERTFTIQGLAEVAGMSRSVFAARFSQSLDRPPMEFLKEVRLDRAARLLARTDLPVKAIATRVGYSSRSAFTRAFQATHHVGPAAFRLDERDPSPAATLPSAFEQGNDRRKGERRRSEARHGTPRLPPH